MNHKVLIVSPHFPPVNAADHQRSRMSLSYLHHFNWDAHVLAVHPKFIQGSNDPFLAKTIPNSISVTYTDALSTQFTQKIGLGNLGLRSYPYLFKAGSILLEKYKFDLVYFSTTVFISMALGKQWKTRFGVSYILDFQDPWINNYYNKSGSPSPPGGKLKYGFSQLIARFLEPKAVSQASHIISVSPAYPDVLQQRYPHLNPTQFTVLPFGASEQDFDLLPTLDVQQTIFDPNDGKRHWVYVGRAGYDMQMSLRSLFGAIHCDRQQNPDRWQSIKLHFIGTSYAPEDRAVKTVEPIAQEFHIDDLVEEQTHRIPYFEALQTLVDSDAIILIGSDDPGYTASKLYPCILARKPILAIFHQDSSVVSILEQCQAGEAVTFQTGDRPHDLLSAIQEKLQKWLSFPKGYEPLTDWNAFQPYTAYEMTRKQCEVFDGCLKL